MNGYKIAFITYTIMSVLNLAVVLAEIRQTHSLITIARLVSEVGLHLIVAWAYYINSSSTSSNNNSSSTSSNNNSCSISSNWKKPSISCDTDRIYINARSNNYSTTNKNECECQKTCGKQDKCEMYLMSSDNTCHLYDNVSNVTESCDSKFPTHQYWGKIKSNK